MKRFILFSGFATLLLSASDCSDKKTTSQKFKGRLEAKGICSNYTIKVMEGNIDTSLVVANWTNEATNKSHTNVFALGNPCDFPARLNEGDEFYFMIDTAKKEPCMVCMAYYPKPHKAISIKVVDK
jgi:hypothetical protein